MGIGGPVSKVSLLKVLGMVPLCLGEGEVAKFDMGFRHASLTRALSGISDPCRIRELELRALFEGEELELMLFNYWEAALIPKEPCSLDDMLVL